MTQHVSIRDGDQLRAAIAAANQTNASIAIAAGVRRQRITSLINGRHPRIRVDAAGAIERACKVPAGTLFVAEVTAEVIEPYLAVSTK